MGRRSCDKEKPDSLWIWNFGFHVVVGKIAGILVVADENPNKDVACGAINPSTGASGGLGCWSDSSFGLH